MKKQMMMTVLAGSLVFSMGFATGAMAEEETQTVLEEASEVADESVAEEVQTEEIEESTEYVSEIVELGDRPEYKASDYVTVGQYKDLQVVVDPVDVTDEQVEEYIHSAMETAQVYDSKDVAEEGDIVNIDYVGKKDGEAFDGGTAQGYDLELGSGTFIDGFEEGLIGAKKGETLDLNLTFPEDYFSEDLAGADVVFTVTVNDIKHISDLNEETVEKVSGGQYSTVDGYRNYVKSLLEEEMEEYQQSTILSDLMTQLYNTCKVNDYPEEVLAYSMAEMNNYYAAYAEAYGMTLDDFIAQYFGMDRDTYNEQMTEVVKQGLQQELILKAIAEAEGLDQVSDQQYEEGCKRYAEQLGYASADQLKEQYDRAKVEVSLIMDAAMDMVKENSSITETEPETETEVMPEESTEAQ